MQKATVTYVPPVGDNKVVEMGGVTFFAGKSVEINSDDNPHLMSKLAGNTHFDVVMGKDEPDDPSQPAAKKRGRPSAADRAAAKEAAEAADKAAKDAADKAKTAKADLDATEKAATAPEGTQKAPKTQTRDLKAGIEEARDHDFEKDRRDNLAGNPDHLPPPKPPAPAAPRPFVPPPEA